MKVVKVLSLDLSTKTGWAVGVKEGNQFIRAESGTLFQDKDAPKMLDDYPHGMLATSERVGDKVSALVEKHQPDILVIEETNLGRNRYSQKLLEWIHKDVLTKTSAYKVNYISTSEWRKVLKISLSKEDKQHNKSVKSGEVRGKISQKHLAIRWVNEHYGLELKPKNEDEADAICMAAAWCAI